MNLTLAQTMKILWLNEHTVLVMGTTRLNDYIWVEEVDFITTF